AVAQLELAPDGDPASAGLGDERRVARDARALDEQPGAVEQGEVVVVAELPVGAGDLDASPRERRRRGPARAREPEDDGAPREHHRPTRLSSGSAASPSASSTNPSGSGSTSAPPVRYQTRGSEPARSG